MRARLALIAIVALAALGAAQGVHGQALSNGQMQNAVTTLPVQPPFQRIGGAYAFPVSTTPQTYVITEPAGAASYRGVNPCGVDIVITSVSPTAQPVTTAPVTYNGQTMSTVQLVTSATGTVDQFSGTLFLARTSETLGSTPNPMGGLVRYVSIMALSQPATACAFRLGYGNGG